MAACATSSATVPTLRRRTLAVPAVITLAGAALSGCQSTSSATMPKSRTEIATAIRLHVFPCWDPPHATTGSFRVLLAVDINPNGTLARKPQVLQYPATSDGPAVANAAVRAVERCVTAEDPLKLPPDLYASWKAIEITFDPHV